MAGAVTTLRSSNVIPFSQNRTVNESLPVGDMVLRILTVSYLLIEVPQAPTFRPNNLHSLLKSFHNQLTHYFSTLPIGHYDECLAFQKPLLGPLTSLLFCSVFACSLVQELMLRQKTDYCTICIERAGQTSNCQ